MWMAEEGERLSRVIASSSGIRNQVESITASDYGVGQNVRTRKCDVIISLNLQEIIIRLSSCLDVPGRRM